MRTKKGDVLVSRLRRYRPHAPPRVPSYTYAALPIIEDVNIPIWALQVDIAVEVRCSVCRVVVSGHAELPDGWLTVGLNGGGQGLWCGPCQTADAAPRVSPGQPVPWLPYGKQWVAMPKDCGPGKHKDLHPCICITCARTGLAKKGVPPPRWLHAANAQPGVYGEQFICPTCKEVYGDPGITDAVASDSV